jgi:hypothetical protein
MLAWLSEFSSLIGLTQALPKKLLLPPRKQANAEHIEERLLVI